MSEVSTGLARLHTALIDAANGYHEALKSTGEDVQTPLFRSLLELHDHHVTQLEIEVSTLRGGIDDHGSFMSTVNRTVMGIRSVLGGLDESVLPGLIDGEKRNLAVYDELLAMTSDQPDIHGLLSGQRQALAEAIAGLPNG
ncbi:MAG: DUF2383 domain-containing protein [Beijerinckiaceae bacterium]